MALSLRKTLRGILEHTQVAIVIVEEGMVLSMLSVRQDLLLELCQERVRIGSTTTEDALQLAPDALIEKYGLPMGVLAVPRPAPTKPIDESKLSFIRRVLHQYEMLDHSDLARQLGVSEAEAKRQSQILIRGVVTGIKMGSVLALLLVVILMGAFVVWRAVHSR